MSYNSSKVTRWMSTTVLKMNSFKNVLQEFCPDFKQWCIPFLDFQNTYSKESLSIIAYNWSARLLSNGLSNVILHACRNCWKTLWIDTPNVFVNYIPPKRMEHHWSGLIFIQIRCWQNFACACSLCKHLIFVTIFLHKIYCT